MRNIVLAIGFAALLVGCSSPAPEVTTIAKKVEVAKGTTVDLVLAKQIDAGSTREGDYVPFLVANDVRDGEGNLILAKGSVVKAEVQSSRGEGSLSGLMNRPARLDVILKEVQAVDGTPVVLVADNDKPDDPYRFTRENTGKPGVDSAKVDDLLKDETNRQLAEKLSAAFNGQTPDLFTPEAKEAMSKFASELGLNDTKKLLEKGQGDCEKISGAIERLQHGDLSGLTKGDLSLTLGSVVELANLAGGLGDRVSRSLKGRTIRAYPGTAVRAFIKDTYTVTVRS